MIKLEQILDNLILILSLVFLGTLVGFTVTGNLQYLGKIVLSVGSVVNYFLKI